MLSSLNMADLGMANQKPVILAHFIHFYPSFLATADLGRGSDLIACPGSAEHAEPRRGTRPAAGAGLRPRGACHQPQRSPLTLRSCSSQSMSMRAPCCCCPILRNTAATLRFDPRVSLLLDATEGHPDPLTGPRRPCSGALSRPMTRAASGALSHTIRRAPATPTFATSISTGWWSSAAISSPASAASIGSMAPISCSLRRRGACRG